MFNFGNKIKSVSIGPSTEYIIWEQNIEEIGRDCTLTVGSGCVGIYIVDDPSVDIGIMCDRALLALYKTKNFTSPTELARTNEFNTENKLLRAIDVYLLDLFVYSCSNKNL